MQCSMSNDSFVFSLVVRFFFFNDTATTEIYTLSLHDALPISRRVSPHIRHPWRVQRRCTPPRRRRVAPAPRCASPALICRNRSEEHTSELQSLAYLVCRLLLEKKKKVFHCQRDLLATLTQLLH